MSYILSISNDALEDIQKHKKAGDRKILKKINTLFDELREHPMTGTGNPEKLKYSSSYWSRRITKKHRLIYSIEEEQIKIKVIQAYGHYGDK